MTGRTLHSRVHYEDGLTKRRPPSPRFMVVTLGCLLLFWKSRDHEMLIRSVPKKDSTNAPTVPTPTRHPVDFNWFRKGLTFIFHLSNPPTNRAGKALLALFGSIVHDLVRRNSYLSQWCCLPYRGASLRQKSRVERRKAKVAPLLT